MQAGIGPFLVVGVGDVESRDTDGEDFVSWFGDSPFDRFLVRIAQNRRHLDRLDSDRELCA